MKPTSTFDVPARHQLNSLRPCGPLKAERHVKVGSGEPAIIIVNRKDLAVASSRAA
jgi:hypothetical protein